MTKVLVLYYSSWGHVERLAEEVAAGAGEFAGVSVAIKRVPELVPDEVARSFHYKIDQKAPLAKPEELADYDAIIIGTPTRYGIMAAQMKNFLDQTGSLWAKGVLVGKVGSVFTSTGTGGGNEATILTTWPLLAHHGLVIVGLPYAAPDLASIEELKGGSPYGAGTIAAPDGSRQPSARELRLARFQGRHVAGIAQKLAA